MKLLLILGFLTPPIPVAPPMHAPFRYVVEIMSMPANQLLRAQVLNWENAQWGKYAPR